MVLLFIIFLVGLVLVFGALSIRHGKQKKETERIEWLKKEYAEYIEELRKTDQEYHDLLKEWEEFHTKYQELGDPSYTVGYSNYKGWPWEQPGVRVPYDKIEAEQNLDTKVNYARNGSIDFRMQHSLPDISQCATFWKDARLAVLGRQEFTPDQLRFIKSKTDKMLDSIIVTVTTNDIEHPTYSMLFPCDDRDTVDDLKAAVNAFKQLK